MDSSDVDEFEWIIDGRVLVGELDRPLPKDLNISMLFLAFKCGSLPLVLLLGVP